MTMRVGGGGGEIVYYHVPLLFVLLIATLIYHVNTLNAFSLGPMAAMQHNGRSTVTNKFVASQSYSAVSLRASSSSTDDNKDEEDDDDDSVSSKDNERSSKKNRKKKDESKHKSHDAKKKKHEKEVRSNKDMDDASDEKMKQVLEVTAAYTTKETTLPKQQQDDDSGDVVQKKLMFIQSLGAITSRGEHATKEQRLAAQQVVSELEESQSNNKNKGHDQEDEKASRLLGRWELVFCDCGQLFRSSPFFMAGRAVCQTEQQAAQYGWFCDMHRKALAISNIGPVRQIITPTQKLVSEFEVVVGAIPFINDFIPFFAYSGGMPVTITGAIVSTADWTKPTATSSSLSKNNDMELYMDTVEIKGSNMPLLRQVLDTGNVSLKSRVLANALEQVVSTYTTPRPIFRTTYLDDLFRIGRDEDDNIFVYVKTSDSTDLTDYSAVDADLGIARLLEGFNDAVTRLYL